MLAVSVSSGFGFPGWGSRFLYFEVLGCPVGAWLCCFLLFFTDAAPRKEGERRIARASLQPGAHHGSELFVPSA